MASFNRHRRTILLIAGAAISGYVIFRAYNHPAIVRKRRKMLTFFEALVSVSESISSSAETVVLISSDLNRFLRSDADELPGSLKQAFKLVTSDEFSGSVSKLSEALTVGIVLGMRSGSGPGLDSSDFASRMLDKLCSKSGSGFASMVVGSFARNLVVGFYSAESGLGSGTESGSAPSWISFVCSDGKCRELIAECVSTFVSSAVAVYLEKTMEVNPYDEFFAGITNPNHDEKVKDLMVSLCNNAVETLVKTTHQVLTDTSSTISNSSTDIVESEQKGDEVVKEDNGWFNQVSSTLAIPTNRRFVLDVTGRVTFETVRSFLEFLMLKLYDGAKGVLGRGVEVVRYFSAKTMLIVTICLTLCTRVMAGTRILMPA